MKAKIFNVICFVLVCSCSGVVEYVEMNAENISESKMGKNNNLNEPDNLTIAALNNAIEFTTQRGYPGNYCSVPYHGELKGFLSEEIGKERSEERQNSRNVEWIHVYFRHKLKYDYKKILYNLFTGCSFKNLKSLHLGNCNINLEFLTHMEAPSLEKLHLPSYDSSVMSYKPLIKTNLPSLCELEIPNELYENPDLVSILAGLHRSKKEKFTFVIRCDREFVNSKFFGKGNGHMNSFFPLQQAIAKIANKNLKEIIVNFSYDDQFDTISRNVILDMSLINSQTGKRSLDWRLDFLEVVV